MWKKTEIPEEPAIQPQAAIQVRSNPAPTQTTGGKAMIGKTIYIKGELRGEEDLLIEGRVEGRIELKQHNITIGKNGHVKADIYGKVITIEGEVNGNLVGEDQLVLRQTSTVRGNIVAPRAILEDGCNFKGSIDMSPKEPQERGIPPTVKSSLSPEAEHSGMEKMPLSPKTSGAQSAVPGAEKSGTKFQ